MKQKIPGKNFPKILGVHVSCKVVLFSRNSRLRDGIFTETRMSAAVNSAFHVEQHS